MTERITVSVNEFCEMSGIGRNSAYRLINEGKLRTALVCGRRLIVVASYLEMIGEKPFPHSFPHSEPASDKQQQTATHTKRRLRAAESG